MFNNTIHNIKIKDIKTELKDGKGKLGLTLECYNSDTCLISEITIPDIDLNIPILEIETDGLYNDKARTYLVGSRKQNDYLSFKINEDENGSIFTMTTMERTVSKEQLEKELGYKLNIK